MAKNKQQRSTETQADTAADTTQLAQTDVEQYDPEDVAALTKLADSYAEVENVQVKVSNDRLSAMVLMRHLNGQHTLLMAARNVSGEVIGVRATLIKAGGDLSGFQKPSDIKPA